MKTIHELITVNEIGDMSRILVRKEEDVVQVELKTTEAPEYFTKVTLNGHSDVIVEAKDGNGHVKFNIPNGAIWDILVSFQVLDKLGISPAESFKIFEAK